MIEIDQRVALITGCGKENGIGAATALRLAGDGLIVVVSDVAAAGVDNDNRVERVGTGWQGLDTLVARIEDAGGKATSLTGDVSTEEGAEYLVAGSIDEFGRLVGRITVDDIIDFIKEEAEKDYQMAAGISEDVEADSSIWQLTRARLPWLILGLFGGLGAVYVMQGFDTALEQYEILFFFTPLIAAMAGNVGVQSSAIIVQGLANDSVKDSLIKRLLKEIGLGIINGTALAILVMVFGFVTSMSILVSVTIAVSILSVIIMAALIGTFIPIILNNRGIDPAIATGPFITTSNDILGILAYFYIAKLILGF